MANNTGTLILSPVRPYSDLDQFPVALSREIKGGHHTRATLAERDSIYPDLLEEGMTCYVLETKRRYVLKDLSGLKWEDDTSTNQSFAYLIANEGQLNL